ncbi:MAG: hypothetical protein IT538_12100 [Variibacter sp.]|nr:hypothetical protein [Variibacter sp.]
MKSIGAVVHSRLARTVARVWIVSGLAGAFWQAALAWNALVTGQTTAPLALGAGRLLVRANDPFDFHVAMLGSLLVALAFLYAAYGAWRLRQAVRPARDLAAT